VTAPNSARLKPNDTHWPKSLTERLGASAPAALKAIGPVALLRAHDTARQLRDEGITVISGFHSPIEKDCLSILVRGKQPIIVCPGRAIEGMRIRPECRAAFEAGRLLFLPVYRAAQARHQGIGAAPQRARRGPGRRSIHRPHHTRWPDGRSSADAQGMADTGPMAGRTDGRLRLCSFRTPGAQVLSTSSGAGLI
jgi:hypothetical protein